MFRPAFSALCEACGTTTTWVKANRMSQRDDAPLALKGFRCTNCDTFETKVLDTRGQVRTRD